MKATVLKRVRKPRSSVKAAFQATHESTEDLTQKIQQKAYELFEQRGYSHGNDLSDWLEAEKIVKAEKSLR